MTSRGNDPDRRPAAGRRTEHRRPTSPRRRRPGRPDARSQATYREHLLRTALRRFLRSGFDGTSLNALAKESGIARDTLYRQYGTKAELFRAATAYGLAQVSERLRVAMATKGTIEERLTRAALELHNGFTAPDVVPVLRLIVAEAHRFPDVARRMFEDSRDNLAPVVDFLTAQRDAGTLDVEDPFEAAFMFGTLAVGGFRVFLRDAPFSAAERRRWAQRVVAALLAGWKCRQASVACPTQR